MEGRIAANTAGQFVAERFYLCRSIRLLSLPEIIGPCQDFTRFVDERWREGFRLLAVPADFKVLL
jgi:hypothetical protein